MEVIKDKTLKIYAALIISNVKKSASNIITGKHADVEKEIQNVVLNIWLNGYDKGFKDRSILEEKMNKE